MSRGYVYVLSNPSMPGVLKIGMSKHGGQGRADALYRNDTGVATPFVLEFELMVADARVVERDAHARLGECRVNARREFFACDIRTATEAVMSAAFGLLAATPPTAEWVAKADHVSAIADRDLARRAFVQYVASDHHSVRGPEQRKAQAVEALLDQAAPFRRAVRTARQDIVEAQEKAKRDALPDKQGYRSLKRIMAMLADDAEPSR